MAQFIHLDAGSVVLSSAAGNPVYVRQTDGTTAYDGARDSSVTAMSAKLPATLGQKTAAASLAVILASDQGAVPVSGTVAATQSGTWNITNVSGTVSLPTGAATEVTLAALSAKHPATLGQKAMAASLAVVIASDQSFIPVSQSGTWNVTNISGTVSLPTGAATETTLAAANTKLVQLTLDTGAASAGLRVTLATRHEAVATPLAAQLSNGTAALAYDSGVSTTATLRTVLATRHESASTPLSVRISDGAAFGSTPSNGRNYADSIRKDYSAGSVTTGAWVQLIASTAATINSIVLFDSSGQTLELGTGAAASETRKLIIPPGGFAGTIPLAIPAGTRVSVRAISATASTGEINITGMS